MFASLPLPVAAEKAKPIWEGLFTPRQARDPTHIRSPLFMPAKKGLEQMLMRQLEGYQPFFAWDVD